MEVSTGPLTNALAALKRALDQPKNEFTRGATIQAFEFSFELSWKLLLRYFKVELNLDLASPRSVLKEAGKRGILADVSIWLDYLKNRNLTVHSYNQETADTVYDVAKKFHPDAVILTKKIEELLCDL